MEILLTGRERRDQAAIQQITQYMGGNILSLTFSFILSFSFSLLFCLFQKNATLIWSNSTLESYEIIWIFTFTFTVIKYFWSKNYLCKKNCIGLLPVIFEDILWKISLMGLLPRPQRWLAAQSPLLWWNWPVCPETNDDDDFQHTIKNAGMITF